MSFDHQTIVPSASRTATGNSGKLRTPQGETLCVIINATAASGTPNFVFTVEWSADGTTFGQPDPGVPFTAITGITSKAKSFTVLAPYYRLLWTVTGGTPNITFSADAMATGSRGR